MFLYSIENNKLEEVKEESFTKEIELHKLCEENLVETKLKCFTFPF